MFRILKLGNVLDTQGLLSQSNIGIRNVLATQGPLFQFDKQGKTMKRIGIATIVCLLQRWRLWKLDPRSMLHVKCLACLSCCYGIVCMDLHSHEKKARRASCAKSKRLHLSCM